MLRWIVKEVEEEEEEEKEKEGIIRWIEILMKTRFIRIKLCTRKVIIISDHNIPSNFLLSQLHYQR